MAYDTFLSNLASYQKEGGRSAYLVRDRREEARKTIETITQGVADGAIKNPDYIAAKDSLNRCVEQAVDHLRDTLFYPVIWAIENHQERFASPVMKFDQAVDTVGLYINAVPGRLKKAKTAPGNDTPYAKAMIVLLTELEPLAKMMADLKTKVVKRQPKPVEERKPGYRPPQTVGEAQKLVVALLESVTEQAYNEMVSRITAGYTEALQEFMRAAKDATSRNFTPHRYFVMDRGRFPDYESFHIVDKVVENDGDTWKQVRNAREIIAAEAVKVADDYRTHFVHKNFRKIASIIDAKGNLESAKAVEHSVTLSGLQGTFIFTFKDGSGFTTVNSVVHSYSVHGRAFLRFPLTFHNVKLPGGAKMGRPSEERMNTVFLGKAE